ISCNRADDSVGRHLSDAVAIAVRYIKIAGTVYRDSLGFVEAGRSRTTAISAEAIETISGDGGDHATWSGLPDAMIERIGDKESTRSIERNAIGAIQLRRECQPAVSAEIERAIPCYCSDDAGGVYLSNAIVERIRDKQAAASVKDNAANII